jgi:hypothetical protein
MSKFGRLMARAEKVDEAQREGHLELGRSLPISGTVPEASTVPETGADIATQTALPEWVPILQQGRKPAALAQTWISLETHTIYQAQNVRWVSLAQHSMTGGQERFYEALWKLKPDRSIEVVLVDKHQKQIRAGYDLLAKVTRCAVSTARVLLVQLAEKKILHSHHDPDSTTRRGTLYDIFSYEEILRRQRAAGLCYVVKKGPGVEFAIPCELSLPETGTVPGIGTVSNFGRESLSEIGRESVPEIGTPLDNKKTIFRQSTPAEFAEQVKQWIPFIDTRAIDRIWQEGQQAIPDITPDDLLDRLKREILALKSKRVHNPVGFLLDTLPIWVNRSD